MQTAPTAQRAPTPARPWQQATAGPAHGLDDEHLELRRGLAAPLPTISPRYLYDELGCALFEAITRTEDYYVTRTEARLMNRHLDDMAAAVRDCLGHVQSVIEPGAGSCTKAQPLCTALRPTRYVGLDIAAAFMARGAERLRQVVPGLLVQTAGMDIRQPLVLPPQVPRRGRLLFYPGTSIGNFSPHDAIAFLDGLRETMGDDGALLIGVDLIKDEQVMQRAYDDREGVTAEFNRNVLRHVNRLILADFEPGHWDHVALWNGQQGRIEMHLRASRAQHVAWDDGERSFAAGDTICTEHSHKYSLQGFGRLLAGSGLHIHRCWMDDEHPFAVILAVP